MKQCTCKQFKSWRSLKVILKSFKENENTTYQNLQMKWKLYMGKVCFVCMNRKKHFQPISLFLLSKIDKKVNLMLKQGEK